MAGDTALSPQAMLSRLQAPARSTLHLAAGCTVLSGWLLIAQAALIASCVQSAFIDAFAPAQLLKPLLALLAVGLLRAGLGGCSRHAADLALEKIRLATRASVVRQYTARGPLWLRQQRSGALSELVASHVDALEAYLGGFVLARIEVIAVPLAILIAVFWVDRVVGTVLLVTMPLIPVFMMLVGWGAEAASRQQLQALTRMGGHFADRLRGLGLIRLYGRGDAELAGVEAAAEGLRSSSLKVLRIAFLSSTVMEFFASISVAMIAVYLGLSYLGMLSLRAEALSLGMGVFCLLLAPEFYAPLRRLAAHYHDRANALAAVTEMQRLLGDAFVNPATAAPDLPSPSIWTEVQAPAIHAHGLYLRPLGAAHAVLENLRFDLAAGGRLALVGPSGCGKSTLLEALAGWLPAKAGELRCTPDGDRIRIGYAGQRPFLFHGSVIDNLKLARPDASNADLHRAADAAQVSRFVKQLPQGWDTLIGERGYGLSGGQARRIALARVFLRQPSLLLLDEPTAFLDADTEAALLEALDRFARGRTLVIATHSQAAMRMTGRVLHLPEGRIAEPGAAP